MVATLAIFNAMAKLTVDIDRCIFPPGLLEDVPKSGNQGAPRSAWNLYQSCLNTSEISRQSLISTSSLFNLNKDKYLIVSNTCTFTF